jgi:myosin heavy subunit
MSSTGFVGTGGQSAEVLHAFKELKAKAKMLESERKETDRENERLRSELSSSRRESFRFRRGAREMQLSDSLASARNEMEVKRKEVAELERDLIVMEDANRSIERGITSGRARLASMSDDASDLCSLVNAQEQECRVKEEELHKLEERCAYLHSRISALPQAKQQQTNRMKEALATMETELQKIQGAADSGRLRAAGLHRYIEMMIGINGELCDTILAREEAKARVLRISGKLTASPSGLGSTVQPFNDVLATVTKSTAAAAAAAAAASTAAGNGLGGVATLENEAQQAVREARAVIKMNSKLYSRGRATPPPPQVVVNATTNGARVSWKQGRGRAVKTKKPAARKKSASKDLFISGE